MKRDELRLEHLRIGNWLRYPDGTPFQVSLEYMSVHDIAPKSYIAQPIPLTREWLVNFQFKEIRPVDEENWVDGRWYLDIDIFESPNEKPEHKFNFAVYVRGDGEFKGGYGITYVHDLQNLYFGITGKDLVLATFTY